MDKKIKICGLTRECDIDYINEAGPDYIGFVFADSRRRVSVADARRMKDKVGAGIQSVGVFVDEQPEKILFLVEEGIIDAVQLHGHEDEYYVKSIKKHTSCPVIKAIHPAAAEMTCGYGQGGSNTENLYDRYAGAGADFLLLDSGSSAMAGGTGQIFDWGLIPRISCPYFLAGGLNIDNIESALRQTKAYGVDISSGVETAGVKDKDKILQIIRRIRNV